MKRLLAIAALLSAACQPNTAPPAPTFSTAEHPSISSPLLFAREGGDGDSWKDTAGREYRLGLVNTPEWNECYGSQATAKRKQLVADGFRAQVYTRDSYRRLVSVITTADGTNVNVWLARYGYANDRYLQHFRHEDPRLAAELDIAFAAARAEHRGLWAACR